MYHQHEHPAPHGLHNYRPVPDYSTQSFHFGTQTLPQMASTPSTLRPSSHQPFFPSAPSVVSFDQNCDPHLSSEQKKAIDKIVSQLEPFEGTQTNGFDTYVKELIFLIEDKCRRRGVLELRPFVLAELLRGASKRWFYRLQRETKYNWEILSRKFLVSFVGDNYKPRLKQELKRKQAPSESINEFNLHFLDCKKELEDLDYKLPEEDLIHIYRLAIHPAIHEKMKATVDKSLEEIMNEARDISKYVVSVKENVNSTQHSLSMAQNDIAVREEIMAAITSIERKFSRKLDELSIAQSHPQHHQFQCNFCFAAGFRFHHAPDTCFFNPSSPAFDSSSQANVNGECFNFSRPPAKRQCWRRHNY